MTGLDNIDAESIVDLYLTNNPILSTCDIQSVCDYLANPNGVILLYGNAAGCASQQELEAACGVGLDESNTQETHINIYPRPATTAITISLPSTTPIYNTVLSIYNVNAQQVISCLITESITVLDISKLPGGVYFVRITDDRAVRVGKFVKTLGL